MNQPDRGSKPTRTPLVAFVALIAGCGDPADPQGSSESGESSSSLTTAPSTSESPSTSSATTDPTTGEPAATTTTSTTPTTPDETATSTGDGSSTGPVACTKNVVLMGYWPPTNEMLRPWSINRTQNPDGWVGEDWGGYGYDVYSFFPEFPPDGDPTNDNIGDDGAVGSPDFDLRVDYQATSADFWRLVDTYQPVILVTTSRGGDIGWELEAIDGGHGMMNNPDPAMDWASDKHGMDQFPSMATVEAATWDAISTYRQGNTLASTLPLDAIVDATDPLGITDVVIDQETGGNFLSGFLGLHGLYYNLQTPHNVAAGHIHVGFGLPVPDASMLIEATLHAVLQQHPFDSVDCP